MQVILFPTLHLDTVWLASGYYRSLTYWTQSYHCLYTFAMFFFSKVMLFSSGFLPTEVFIYCCFLHIATRLPQTIFLETHWYKEPSHHYNRLTLQLSELKLAEASRVALMSKLASAPLPEVQWLSGKSIRLIIGRFQVWLPCSWAGISPKFTSLITGVL